MRTAALGAVTRSSSTGPGPLACSCFLFLCCIVILTLGLIATPIHQKALASSRCLLGRTFGQSASTLRKILRSSRCHTLDRSGGIGKRPRHGNGESYERARIRMLDPCTRVAQAGQIIARREFLDLIPRISRPCPSGIRLPPPSGRWSSGEQLLCAAFLQRLMGIRRK